MSRAFYSREHYRRLSNGGPDTPEQVSERRLYARAAELAIADREARFPTLTAENAREAIAYQGARLQDHYAALQKAGLR